MSNQERNLVQFELACLQIRLLARWQTDRLRLDERRGGAGGAHHRRRRRGAAHPLSKYGDLVCRSRRVVVRWQTDFVQVQSYGWKEADRAPLRRGRLRADLEYLRLSVP